MKIFRLELFFVFSVQMIFSNVNAQNLALHKKYTLSVPPNYQYSAPASDHTSLTDGIYTKGFYWTKPTTDGWFRKGVSISIDLGEVKTIGEVCFSTVRSSNQGVNFPKDIYVFISKDEKNFEYVGDAANTPSNIDGAYEVKQLNLKGINAPARFVTCVVVPSGNLLFCDEVEILEGEKSNNLDTRKLISKDSIDAVVKSFEILNFERRSLELVINRLLDSSKVSRSDKEYLKFKAELRNDNASTDKLQEIKRKIGQLHASKLKTEFATSFLVTKCNPFGVLSRLNTPNKNPQMTSYQFAIPEKLVQYGAFSVTNLDSIPQQFIFSLINMNNSINEVALFQVPFVPSVNYNFVPDPLIPVTNRITINSGFSQMFIFKVLALNSGYSKNVLEIRSGSQKIQIKISTQVNNLLREGSTVKINANVWAYLNYPMLKDREVEAARDLELHHVNTVVIPPGILPNIQSSEYAAFISYLRNFKAIDNFLLFMNYSSATLRNGNDKGMFMSNQWKKEFINWYKNISKLIKENGFPQADIFLYPYDEVRGHDIEDFISLIKWAKMQFPGIKFYATLGDKPSVDSLLALVDLAQISSTYLGMERLPPHKSDIWIYSTASAARSLSPYVYYRLMAWQAFLNDYKGIGFWDYADEGANKRLNLVSEPLPNDRSYSVVYTGSGTNIISSRRWEAFQLGIEDYSIIKAYSNKVGLDSAKLLVKGVLCNSINPWEADSVRNKMIARLAQGN